jgi:O-antigen/teichoic acid export membrane protein
MPGLLRRLFSESAVYGVGGMANQAVAILLVPIYARVLGAENYGVLAIVNTTISLTLMLTTLALPQAFFRSYLKEATDDAERLSILRTSITLRLVVSCASLAIMLAAAAPIAILLFGGNEALPLAALLAPIVFFDSLNAVPLSFLRAQRRPRPYAVVSFTRALLGSLLIVFFVVVADLGVLGAVLGSLGSAMVSTSLGFALLLRSVPIRLEWDSGLVRHMLAFSLPLVPAAVAGWTLNLSDRYILQALQDERSVGIYAMGYTLGLIINALAIAPFTLAWGAAYWEISRLAEARQIIARVMTAYAFVATFVALGLSALSTDAIRILLTAEFEPSRFVVPFSAFAYVTYGVYTIAATGLNLESQTRWLPISMGAAAVSGVALNFLLIPHFSLMGAAYSTLISYGLLALISGAISQRYYHVEWQYRRLALTLGLGVGLSLAAIHGPDSVWWRLLCLAVYPPLVMLAGVISPGQVREMVRSLARRGDST